VNNSVPRLRMFAGPNGSGKSTLKTVLRPELIGIYLNPDEVGNQIEQNGFLDLASYNITTTVTELSDFLRESTLLTTKKLTYLADNLQIENGRLTSQVNTNELPYFVSALADFIRRTWLKNKISFTFETVMSARDKVGFLKEAQAAGYRTYLYYICTNDPEINVPRVKFSFIQGVHDVPRDKIVSRYHRSLDLLFDAIGFTNRAYIFDNSGEGTGHTWIAEITDGKTLTLKTESVPVWFTHSVIDKRTSIQS